MLTIHIDSKSFWNEEKEEFVTIDGTDISFEHSLLSISQWESKWKKPFLASNDKSVEEIMDYIKIMTLTPVDDSIYALLSEENIRAIFEYMNDPMTATTFKESELQQTRSNSKGRFVTSELVYFWMANFRIPIECERWHFNRLMTLIRICAIENSPPKKMNKRDVMNRNRALNKARRAKTGSRG